MFLIDVEQITGVEDALDAETGEEIGATESTITTSVNPDAIRCFYPRKQGRPGTRLTFNNGTGFAIKNAYDAVKEALAVVAATEFTMAEDGLHGADYPVSVMPKNVRNFYPRHGDEPGTRITFTDGHGFAVKEEVAEVRGRLSPS